MRVSRTIGSDTGSDTRSDTGYEQRFGLVRVDYDTLARTPKDSHDWFRGLITAHGARTEEPVR